MTLKDRSLFVQQTEGTFSDIPRPVLPISFPLSPGCILRNLLNEDPAFVSLPQSEHGHVVERTRLSIWKYQYLGAYEASMKFELVSFDYNWRNSFTLVANTPAFSIFKAVVMANIC
ncbi:hypothetical protein E1B28_005031 [Marasmius oreades]|uniref:Uncharacterized protein n=1 Tax=Marasmius oreades TaxID=181124 RepID=A0A9P8ADK9_9AGAR|nr:uncharacterized protein E1B28_005031 [Marasmius oreades]KAG7097707.1 hypothetical protein E1B28_005031 [Marasmius oreades]